MGVGLVHRLPCPSVQHINRSALADRPGQEANAPKVRQEYAGAAAGADLVRTQPKATYTQAHARGKTINTSSRSEHSHPNLLVGSGAV
jgi:hypothetical protein